jgi:hypothetical protein
MSGPWCTVGAQLAGKVNNKVFTRGQVRAMVAVGLPGQPALSPLVFRGFPPGPRRGQALIEHALALASLGIVSRPHDPAGYLGSSMHATGRQIDAEE